MASHVGLEDLALREMGAALKLNPGSAAVRRGIIVVYTVSGRWSEAVTRGRELETRPDPATDLDSFLHLDRRAEALELAFSWDPDGPWLPDPPDPLVALTLAVAGKKDEAAFLTQLFEGGYPLDPGIAGHHGMHALACTEALLGRPEQAVAWLRKASEAGLPNYLLFSRDPLLDSIRGHPAFIQFMAELKPRWERWTAEYR